MNRRHFQTALTAAALVPIAQTAHADVRTPLRIVQARMALYNAHQLDEFLALYSQEIAIYDYPDKLLGRGLARQRELFAPIFAAGATTTVHTQISMGDCVVNDETVSYPDRQQRYVSIYEIKDGLIGAVRFIR